MLGWMVRTRPDLACTFSQLSKYSTKPVPRLLEAVAKALFYVADHPRELSFSPLQGDPVLVLWTDASYSITEYTGRGGFEIQLVSSSDLPLPSERNLVMWRSYQIKSKLGSTTSAEGVSLRDGLKALCAFQQLVKKLWKKTPKMKVLIDSAPLLSQLASGKARAKPALQGMLDYTLQTVKTLGATVERVGTEEMRADRMTKFRLE